MAEGTNKQLFIKSSTGTLESITPLTNTDATGDKQTGITLDKAVRSMGQFMGVITPEAKTSPIFNDGKYCVMASTPGTYPQCGNLSVASGEIAVFICENKKWLKQTLVADMLNTPSIMMGYEPLCGMYLYSVETGRIMIFANGPFEPVYIGQIEDGMTKSQLLDRLQDLDILNELSEIATRDLLDDAIRYKLSVTDLTVALSSLGIEVTPANVFASNVLAENGFTNGDALRESYSALPDKVKKDAISVILSGAHRSGRLYGMNPRTGEITGRYSFTRATSGTYFDKDFNLKTGTVNAPRFDYNNYLSDSVKVLLEPARTNYNAYPFALDMWQRFPGVDIFESPVKFADYDNYRELYKTEGTATTNGMYKSISIPANTSTSLSVTIALRKYEIGSPRTSIRLRKGSGDFEIADISARIRSGSGAISIASGGYVHVTGLGDEDTIIEINYSNIDMSAGTTAYTLYVYPNSLNTAQSTVLVSCVMVEVGAFATSVIPEEYTITTRSADNCTIPISANGTIAFGLADGSIKTQTVSTGTVDLQNIIGVNYGHFVWCAIFDKVVSDSELI